MLSDEYVERLKIFYNVDTDRELIAAMDHHIEKLQEKLHRLSPPEHAILVSLDNVLLALQRGRGGKG